MCIRDRDSAAQCAAGCGVVITIVGYPQDVEEVYFGPGGLLESAQPGTVLIDMTTTSPKLAQRIYDQARERGLDALDADVYKRQALGTGGRPGGGRGCPSVPSGRTAPETGWTCQSRPSPQRRSAFPASAPAPLAPEAGPQRSGQYQRQLGPVSYTHLDVYKRQACPMPTPTSSTTP